MSLSEIVERTQLNKSTAYYLLQALLSRHAIDTDEMGRYRLGVGLIALGAAASEGMTELGVAKRYLAELLERMNVTIIIYQRIAPSEIMLIDKLERVRRVRITVPLGARMPIQGGSYSRVFLAYDSVDEVDQLLEHGLHALTPKSITDIEAFKEELELVRQRGWTLDHEGFALGVSTVAAPIFGSDGSVRLVGAAVTFTSSLSDETAEQYGSTLRDTCDHISQIIRGTKLSLPDSVALPSRVAQTGRIALWACSRR
jgi:DNA-binding IclR family transcriptional regulator